MIINKLQASNFLRSFRTIHEANALNLVIVDTDCNLKSDRYHFNPLAQNWGRFIIQHIQMVIIGLLMQYSHVFNAVYCILCCHFIVV